MRRALSSRPGRAERPLARRCGFGPLYLPRRLATHLVTRVLSVPDQCGVFGQCIDIFQQLLQFGWLGLRRFDAIGERRALEGRGLREADNQVDARNAGPGDLQLRRDAAAAHVNSWLFVFRGSICISRSGHSRQLALDTLVVALQ